MSTTIRSYHLDFDLPFGDLLRAEGIAEAFRIVAEGALEGFKLKGMAPIKSPEEIMSSYGF